MEQGEAAEIARMEDNDDEEIPRAEQGAAALHGGAYADEEVSAAPALQHSLPMQLNLDPSRMLAMHGSLFPAQQQQQPSLDAVAAASINPPALSGSVKHRHVWKRPATGPVTTSVGGE